MSYVLCASSLVSEEEYLKFLYSKEVRDIASIVMDIADRLEYSGSFIYDEYPDKTYLYKTSSYIHDIINKKLPDLSNDEYEKYYLIADIIFINEIYHRRQRYLQNMDIF